MKAGRREVVLAGDSDNEMNSQLQQQAGIAETTAKTTSKAGNEHVSWSSVIAENLVRNVPLIVIGIANIYVPFSLIIYRGTRLTTQPPSPPPFFFK